MKKYVKITELNNRLLDMDKQPYQFAICCVEFCDDTVATPSIYVTTEELQQKLEELKPTRIVLHVNLQEELDFLGSAFAAYVKSLDLKTNGYRNFDLSVLQRFVNLETVNLQWNTKSTQLWNVALNPKLRSFRMIDFNKITDFSCFANSNVENLQLWGCNNLSSFKSKLDIGDVSFLQKMPNLKVLSLDIVKSHEDDYYLTEFGRLANLQHISLPDSFFTFEQFAHLSAKLPNVTGLEPYRYIEFTNQYVVIGKDTPKSLNSKQTAEDWAQKYEELKGSLS